MAKRALDIDLQPKEINIKDPRSTAQAIFRKWLPISDSILRMVVRCVPGPELAQGKRVNTFYPDLKNNCKILVYMTVHIWHWIIWFAFFLFYFFKLKKALFPYAILWWDVTIQIQSLKIKAAFTIQRPVKWLFLSLKWCLCE